MASSLSRRSSTSSGPVLSSYSSTGFASASSRFSSSTATSTTRNTSSCFDHNNHRSESPTRVNLYNFGNGLSSSSSASRKISSTSKSSRSVAVNSANSASHQNRVPSSTNQQKRTCMCSPTNHPGSFRCSLHKNTNNSSVPANNYQSNNQRLSARRSAMTNSIVRISTVEGDLVRRALASLIRPSSHNQRRRSGFQPRQSRLSVMSR
ncbi:hypothetical protein MKX01_019458 [Papaver californicum]|nr:hypothetical protein MKX01_019458 [Papaver californicum]